MQIMHDPVSCCIKLPQVPRCQFAVQTYARTFRKMNGLVIHHYYSVIDFIKPRQGFIAITLCVRLSVCPCVIAQNRFTDQLHFTWEASLGPRDEVIRF